HGLRNLLKRPGFTAIVLVVLGLGIGSTTAIFSIVDALLLRSLPYPESERLVLLREVGAKGNLMAVAGANFQDVQASSQSFDALAIAAGSFPLVVTGAGEPMRARISYASGGFVKAMGVQPMAGRSFLPEEEKFGGPVAVMLSYGFWQKQLGGRADFGAVKLNVDGVNCNVVGILPAGFDYPTGTEIWNTGNTEPANPSRTAHNHTVIGRLRSGTSLEEARSEVSLIAQRLRATYGDKIDAVDFTLIPLQTHLTRNVRQALWLLLGAVGLLLLVTCANFSNLLLAQMTARQREFTIRCALGASRFHITRQLLVENLLLTIPAAALGAWLASFGVRLLLLLDKGTLPRINTIGVNSRVLLFSCALGVLIGVALSFLPAIRFSRQLNFAMQATGRGQVSTGIGNSLRAAMVIGQIGLTVVLLAAAGLLGRSFFNLMKVDPGFNTESAVVMTLTLPTTISPDEDEHLRQFYVQLLERIGQFPGVTAVGGINVLPLSAGPNGTFLIDDDPNQRGYADYRVASAGYFPATKIPLIKGRLFDSSDTVKSPHVAVISQSLAQRYWANEDPIGKRIQFGNMDTDKHLLHVVGVVGDVRSVLEREAQPTVYAFSLQRPQWWQVAGLDIVVRANADPDTLVPALRSTVQSLRSDAPATFSTLGEVFSSAFDARRFSLVLFGVFAGVALLITIIGLYGMLAYLVAERRREIGIRMALGAQPRNVLRLVIGQGLKLALIGVIVGLIGAWALTRFMQTLLFGVNPTDPGTFAVIGLLLLLVAFVACWVPARRATKVDPLVALRYE
ncbi:MAG TPA: ABC transporter permease, partial [Pyrinomonadaceae bacterium]|nr:ABC transporter permease [Pyrinomonadaceae bacterium]